jgi:hypothetical protein
MSFPEGALLVKSGDIPSGVYGVADTLISKDELTIWLTDLHQCTIVSDRHEAYQTGVGRIAGGIIGAALLGPIGAAGGLLAGGKRRIDETVILCRLFDGRSFTAECSQLTAARLTQVAMSNQTTQSTNITKPGSSASVNTTFSGIERDSDNIDCPLCAERIKAKAKICRYCGCDIHEVRKKEIDSIKKESIVEEVYDFGDLYQTYASSLEGEDIFDRESALEVMTLFSQIQKIHPDLSYRDWAEMVKDEFGGNTKQPLYDLIKHGFRFLRANKHFDVVDDRYIVIKQR